MSSDEGGSMTDGLDKVGAITEEVEEEEGEEEGEEVDFEESTGGASTIDEPNLSVD